MNSRSIFSLALFAALFAAQTQAQYPQEDPPSRIARLNYIEGNVSMQPGGLTDWTQAEINRPFTTGDSVYTDAASRAEFHLDTAIIRAGEYTNFAFLTLNDQTIQLSLTEGDLYINLREVFANQTVEVDSPNASISLSQRGIYRFRISSNGTLTFVVVRQGQAEIAGGGQAFSLTPGNSAALSGSDQLAFDINQAPPPDDFDLWSQDRDAREARSAALRYLPRSVVGYEDMDDNGDWQPAEGYGPVWYPRTVVAGWAPYRYGHWAWIEPWGWTWVDDASWGFAPFHYGRWIFVAGRWGWSPGPILVVANRPPVVRPVYAPALVAWFGGAHFSVGIGLGGGAPSLGWVPLGFGEVYTPSYHCSPRYFSNVNVSNTTIVKTVNITNVYNTVYVNKTVYNQTYVNVQAPNAVTAMPHAAFAGGRSAAQAGFAMKPRDVQSIHAEATVIAPPVAPTRQALLASHPSTAPVARPAPLVTARPVVMERSPATAPSSFAARQTYLQQHVGEAHNFTVMHAQVAPHNTPQPAFNRSPVVPAPAPRPAAQSVEPHNQPVAPRNESAPARYQPAAPRNESAPPPNQPVVPRNESAPPTSQPVTPRSEVAPGHIQPAAPRNENAPAHIQPKPPSPAPEPKAYPEREHSNPPPPHKDEHKEEHKDKPKDKHTEDQKK